MGWRFIGQPGLTEGGDRAFEADHQHPFHAVGQHAHRLLQRGSNTAGAGGQGAHGDGLLALNGGQTGGRVVHRLGEIGGREAAPLGQGAEQAQGAIQLPVATGKHGAIHRMAGKQLKRHLDRQASTQAHAPGHHHGDMGRHSGCRRQPEAILSPRQPLLTGRHARSQGVAFNDGKSGHSVHETTLMR